MFNKIGLYIIIILFASFAVMQYNDPDGLKWGILYLIIALLSSITLLRKNRPMYIGFVIGFCVIWMISILPEFTNWIKMGMPSITESMKTDQPHIEYTREFLGLFISIFALLYIHRVDKKINNS